MACQLWPLKERTSPTVIDIPTCQVGAHEPPLPPPPPTAPQVNVSHVLADTRSETSGANAPRFRSALTNLPVTLPVKVKAPPARSPHLKCSHVPAEARSATSGANVPRF